jgi:hypothetical protein
MTSRTRYFVIASLLALLIGLGTGLVAYYVGFPTRAFFAGDGPDELQFVPPDATLVAFANVREIMTSDLRERARRALPRLPNGQEQFRNETGINIETDIDRVVACLGRLAEGGEGAGRASLVLARGRFDAVRIESLMRDHGASVGDHGGVRLITGAESSAHPGGLSLAFIEPGLVGVGSASLVRAAIDLKNGGKSVTTNNDMMKLVRSLDAGNVWAVGRFDALAAQAKLPSGLAAELLPITWFAASAHVNGGLRGVLRAETRDEASANNLRDVVRGFLALAKLQAGSRPELQTLMQSLDLGGAGTTVALSFSLPVEMFDRLGAAVGQGILKPR